MRNVFMKLTFHDSQNRPSVLAAEAIVRSTAIWAAIAAMATPAVVEAEEAEEVCTTCLPTRPREVSRRRNGSLFRGVASHWIAYFRRSGLEIIKIKN